MSILVDNVSKIFPRSFDQSRRRAMRAMFLGPPTAERDPQAGEFYALRHVSFRVPTGESLLVLGAPGAGKTTLVQILSGLIFPDAGHVRIEGRCQVVGGGRLPINDFMPLHEALEIAVAFTGVPPSHNRQTGQQLLEFCGLEAWRSELVADLPAATLDALTYAAGLLADADVYLFDSDSVPGEGVLRERLMARLQQILETKTTVVTARRVPRLPAAAQHGLILHKGQPLALGEARSIVFVAPAYLEEMRLDSKDVPAEPGASHTQALVSRTLLTRTVSVQRDPAAQHLLDRLGTGAANAAVSPLAIRDRVVELRLLGKTVVAGPWLTDVALESLYWIPFLSWVRQRLAEGQRLVAVSAGGMDAWYRRAGCEYVDLLDIMSAAELDAKNRQRAAQTGSQKQLSISEFERDILERLAPGAIEDGTCLHPSHVFSLWSEIWRGRLPPEFVTRHARYDPPPAVGDDAPQPGLPADYVAMKFEFSPYFPETARNRELAESLIDAVRRFVPVVMLNTGFGTDNYREGVFQPMDQVFPIAATVDPRTHLDLQWRAIARSRAFVGTYGGVSYLAPFCGVNAFTVYSDPVGFFSSHLGGLRAAAYHLGDVGYVATPATQADPEAIARQVADLGARSLWTRLKALGARPGRRHPHRAATTGI